MLLLLLLLLALGRRRHRRREHKPATTGGDRSKSRPGEHSYAKVLGIAGVLDVGDRALCAHRRHVRFQVGVGRRELLVTCDLLTRDSVCRLHCGLLRSPLFQATGPERTLESSEAHHHFRHAVGHRRISDHDSSVVYDMSPACPRLAWPCTVAARGGEVWLIAGEDIRFSFRLPGGEDWVRAMLDQCDGAQTSTDVIASVPEPNRGQAEALLDRLISERVVLEEAPLPDPVQGFRLLGTGAVAARLHEHQSETGTVEVYCQDDLNYKALLEQNRRALDARQSWMWVSTGPSSRAYVSPLFIPHGPCAACLLQRFQLLSPCPEIYDLLSADGPTFVSAEFPEHALEVVSSLTQWKLQQSPHSPALFQLHVVEVGDLSTSVHSLARDPTCSECAHYTPETGA